MIRRQATVIISLFAILILALVGVGAVLASGSRDSEADGTGTPRSSTSVTSPPTSGQSSTSVVEPARDIEAALLETDSVTPVPEAEPVPTALQAVAPTVTAQIVAPYTAPVPTLVECLVVGLVARGLYSDGSILNSPPECEDHPELVRSREGESVCGGMYGWEKVTAERYLEMCGRMPPTDEATTVSPGPDVAYDAY